MVNFVLDKDGRAQFCRDADGDVPVQDLENDSGHCFVVCKRLGPNVFFIKSGLAVFDEQKHAFTPDGLSLTCPTKIIFLPQS